MSDNENRFLQDAFKNYRPGQKPDDGFSEVVLRKISYQRENKALITRFLRIFIPIFFVCVLGMSCLLYFKGNVIFHYLSECMPDIKPWYIFVFIAFLYFHFVRSLLILAFLYLKKRINFAYSF